MAGRFPLLLDEHVSRSLAQALRQLGWAVARVVDLKVELGPGAEDEQVFTYASKQGYVVLSSDERALWRPRLHSEHGDPFPGTARACPSCRMKEPSRDSARPLACSCYRSAGSPSRLPICPIEG